MNKYPHVIALLGLIIISINFTPVFGQILDSIVVTTDKSSYLDGETIIVSGEVKVLLSGFDVSLLLLAPNGNIVTLEQFGVGDDKKFSLEITAGGPLMKQSGEYTVQVLYGAGDRTAETTFEFEGSSDTGSTPISQPSIPISGTILSIDYMITGGNVLSINTEQPGSLIIEIETTDDGELTITLPRAVIDATLDGEDDVFFVLIDGEEVSFDEIETTDMSRTLKIPFFDGATEIEIIGTFVVVPEFGTIAGLILAIAIISIIAVSAKTRLSIIPR